MKIPPAGIQPAPPLSARQLHCWHQARRRLRESASRFRSLFRQSALGMVITDLRGDFKRVNPKFCTMLGYEEADLLGKNVLDLTLEEDRERDIALHRELIKEERRRVWMEKRFRHRQGQIVWAHISSVLLRDQEGMPSQVISQIQDTTLQREAEKALRQGEERYRTILDSIEEGYFEVDLTGNLTFFNASLCRITGYDPKRLPGMNNREYSTPETARRMYRAFSTVYNTGAPLQGLQYEVVCQDGHPRLLELSATLIRDAMGRPTGFRGVTRDITARKQVEEERRKFESIVATSKDMMLFIDDQYRHQACNGSYLAALGRSKQEVQGRSVAEVWGEERFRGPEGLRSKLDRCLAGEDLSIQKWVDFPAAGSRYMDISGSPFRDEEGRITGLVINAHDKTASKRLEDQLQHAQKMEALGTLAGGVAHNFNNLLMGIQGNTSLLLMEIEEQHPLRARLENIAKLIQSGSRLTNQLLGYAREGKYEVRTTDLNQVLIESASTFAMTRKDIKVSRDLATGLPGIQADRGQIEQVLFNLYINAADAMPRGGELRLETGTISHYEMEQRPFRPKPGRYVRLIVSDTGIGMEREVQERIFEPFFTTKEMGKGTGLGLASVYGIVKGHGGYIVVESEKGRGTSFRIYLPLSEGCPEADQAPSDGTESVGHGTVLIVDDEEIVLDVSARMLQRSGFMVLEARNGGEALEIYRRNPGRIDIVILDMIMPGMGGGEVFDRLRQIDPQACVLLSSGYSMDGQASEILQRGCNGFIQKPFDMRQLKQKIGQVLASKPSAAAPVPSSAGSAP